MTQGRTNRSRLAATLRVCNRIAVVFSLLLAVATGVLALRSSGDLLLVHAVTQQDASLRSTIGFTRHGEFEVYRQYLQDASVERNVMPRWSWVVEGGDRPADTAWMSGRTGFERGRLSAGSVDYSEHGSSYRGHWFTVPTWVLSGTFAIWPAIALIISVFHRGRRRGFDVEVDQAKIPCRRT